MKILVVDDEKAQRDALAGFLKTLDHEVATADSAQTALAYLHKNPADIVLSDFKMPYMTGNDLLKEIRQRYPRLVVIIMTAFGTVEVAVEAMKTGAWDFVTKPVDLDQLELQLAAVAAYLARQETVPDTGTEKDTGIIALDQAMLDILNKARRVAGTDAIVMITGETGTGKEELARYIHLHSKRKKQELHVVNCAALPANLVESELFGHVKGSFTGAAKERIGQFEAADGSTLFLDEIGDLPLDMQVKLLRFLQNGEYQRVGSNEIRKSDVRVLAATNVNLELAVEQGDFREDLFYRLDVIRFHIPPLRERPADIRAMINSFLKDFTRLHNRPDLKIDETAQTVLSNYHFSGNIRELRNIIERAVVLAGDTTIKAADLELRTTPPRSPSGSGLIDSIQTMEQELITKSLKECGGNQSECARRLGISERVLRYKLQKYNLR